VPLNSNDLFRHADELIKNHRDDTDLSRAVSAAYYGLFHFVLTAVANWLVGPGNRKGALHEMVYTSIDHKALVDLCADCLKLTPSEKVKPYIPTGGFGTVGDFARVAVSLYGQRILADYDRTTQFNAGDTRLALDNARSAVRYFERATLEQREVFMTLLLPLKRRPR
jgi:hypothetical protein